MAEHHVPDGEFHVVVPAEPKQQEGSNEAEIEKRQSKSPVSLSWPFQESPVHKTRMTVSAPTRSRQSLRRRPSVSQN